MKVLQVAMGIAPESGGPTRSCKGLCRALAQAGVDVTLYVLSGHHPFEDPCGVKVIYAEDIPLYTYTSNLHLFSLVHLQGLWAPGLHRIATACRRAHIPYIVSPRGMLDPWALSVKKLKKLLALWLYQRRDLKGAVAFHVTAEMECDHVRALGFTQPCIVAPNGVSVPAISHFSFFASNTLTPRTAIFLSRLHPGKGLIPLAEAWARVKPQGWRMLVVGPDSYGHKTDVIKKLDALGISHTETSNAHPSTPNFSSSYWEFQDQVDDTEKWNLYRLAEILIHPSVSENFGITIAEGLYAGLPVICTKGTPWKDLIDYDCGLWIDLPEKKAGGECGWTVKWPSLDAALTKLLTLQPSELRAMGENGHKLILEKYTWPAIAQSMVQGYAKVLIN